MSAYTENRSIEIRFENQVVRDVSSTANIYSKCTKDYYYKLYPNSLLLSPRLSETSIFVQKVERIRIQKRFYPGQLEERGYEIKIVYLLKYLSHNINNIIEEISSVLLSKIIENKNNGNYLGFRVIPIQILFLYKRTKKRFIIKVPTKKYSPSLQLIGFLSLFQGSFLSILANKFSSLNVALIVQKVEVIDCIKHAQKYKIDYLLKDGFIAVNTTFDELISICESKKKK